MGSPVALFVVSCRSSVRCTTLDSINESVREGQIALKIINKSKKIKVKRGRFSAFSRIAIPLYYSEYNRIVILYRYTTSGYLVHFTLARKITSFCQSENIIMIYGNGITLSVQTYFRASVVHDFFTRI